MSRVYSGWSVLALFLSAAAVTACAADARGPAAGENPSAPNAPLTMPENVTGLGAGTPADRFSEEDALSIARLLVRGLVR